MKQIHKEITEDEASARAVAGEDYDGGLSRHRMRSQICMLCNDRKEAS